MPGPTPKDPKLRQRTNKVATAAVLKGPARVRMPTKLPEPRVVAVMVEGSDGKPQLVEVERAWHVNAVAFWREVRRSPMVGEYLASDLSGLLLLADLVDRYWYGNIGLATEIRLQRQCYGLTPIDRRRLQWEIKPGEAAPPKPEPTRVIEPSADPRRLFSVV